jgi:hypothetical protein
MYPRLVQISGARSERHPRQAASAELFPAREWPERLPGPGLPVAAISALVGERVLGVSALHSWGEQSGFCRERETKKT